jgi:hypothetical protein
MTETEQERNAKNFFCFRRREDGMEMTVDSNGGYSGSLKGCISVTPWHGASLT